MSNRRDFLRNASLLTLGGMMAGSMSSCTPAAAATRKRIGLQTYSLNGELTNDFAAGLPRLKEMGYDYVELAGVGGGKVNGTPIDEFLKMANDAGIQILSSHVNPPTGDYTKENLEEIKDWWKASVEEHTKLGVKYLVQPGKPRTRNVEDAQLAGEFFTEAGKIAKAAGIQWGYHNHDGEFEKVIPGGERPFYNNSREGEKIYDVFLRSTDPEFVCFEMDVYWTVMGRNDPVEYMQKFGDRIKLLHIKDRYVLGESGLLNFKKIFEQHYANGHDEFFVEIEDIHSGHQFAGVEACINYLKNADFVK